MLRIIAFVVSIPLALLLSTLILGATGVSYGNIRDRAKLNDIEEPRTQRFAVVSGAEVTVTCRKPAQAGIGLRCALWQESVYLMRLQLAEVEATSQDHWQLSAQFQLLPSEAEAFRSRSKLLSDLEKTGEVIPIAELFRGMLGTYVWGNYNIDREAMKALVASYISKAVTIKKLELGNADIERTAEIFVDTLAPHMGVFDLRADAYVMIFEGWMEYVIIFFFFMSLLLLVASLFLEDSSVKSRGNLWSASDSIAGTLTYLGLLGTLIGMFGTVTALSRIDYVDPMVKVFDQTSSFGSMSLAIGTSVVGLTGSIIIWFAQVVIDVVRK